MNSKNKNILVRIRMDEATANLIRSKADRYFNGNVSACIRCCCRSVRWREAAPGKYQRFVSCSCSHIAPVEETRNECQSGSPANQ